MLLHSSHEKYMLRCIELAAQGFGTVAPNPLVGCVIVHNRKIIGEGFHRKYGEAHAEVNAVNSVKAKNLLSESTLYVNLEPCSHFGKTPPCADVILKNKIPRVVIGCADSNKLVSGKGIEKLQKNNCEVIFDVLEKESRELNKRFFTFHEKKRPYIILKWAQTLDGFIGEENLKSQISNHQSQILSHKWRSEEQAILIGTNTVFVDNPQLNVREWKGKNPVRIVIDKNLRLSQTKKIFDGNQPSIIFNEQKNSTHKNLEFVMKTKLHEILDALHIRGIQSLIVEGGAKLLHSFIKENVWDEARVFVAAKIFKHGVKAPDFPVEFSMKEKIGDDDLFIFRNQK